jgi:hypothetical protein
MNNKTVPFLFHHSSTPLLHDLGIAHISHYYKPVTRNSQHVTYSILHRISVFAFVASILIFCCVLPGLAAASPEQPARQENLVSEYSKQMGFAKHQVLDASINNSVLKLSINECSFCGAFKDDKKRSDIAHKTLDWFLAKTGQKEGTVEWYNKSQQKIMVITGSSAQAEISTGPSCAIQNRLTQ